MTNQETIKRVDELLELLNGFKKQLEIDVRAEQGKKEKDITPDGIISKKNNNLQNNESNENYNTNFYSGVISDIERKISCNDNPMITITVELNNGMTVVKKFSFKNEGVKYYILSDFMVPLGITGFNINTPIKQFMDFPYEDYIGTKVVVSLKDEFQGVMQIGQFFKNHPSSWNEWDE